MAFKTQCIKCSGETRLVGIEPHHKIGDLDIWTLECNDCGHVGVEMPRQGTTPLMAQTVPSLN
ncbi:MAG: hypothetical protein QOG38_1736 [Hyphomicrobiales bacterium]|jgi:uncharacterized Zn finger protein|nr:hypothetical protein [Hyphomicrobiales bacterium]